MSSDPLNQLDQASQSGFPFVSTVVHRRTVNSTNALARGLLLQGLDSLPLLAWADTQTFGKGQRDSLWWSDAGSLTFSIGVDPPAHGLRRDQEPRVSLAMALSVIKAINMLGWANPGIGIRWPNDLEIGDRKLGGILPELLETGGGHRLLIGVGLNVLTCLDQAPVEIKRMATSISALQASPLEVDSIPRLLDGILRQFDQEIQALAADSSGQAQEWDRLNLLRGQVVQVNLGARVITGWVDAIDAQGALLLRDQDTSQAHRLFGGQVLRYTTTSTVPRVGRSAEP